MADTRTCEQCGTSFTPRREHARFCSPRCRVVWNRRHASEPPAETGALGWAIAAMLDINDRLQRAEGWDRADGFAAISEAVWWVTMVDATLVRYHLDAYSNVLDRQPAEQRATIEDTFGALRFVRNQMGYESDPADFVQPLNSLPWCRRSAHRCLDLEVTARPCARITCWAGTGVGAIAVPRLPAPASRTPHR